jgi:hypothetical protein
MKFVSKPLRFLCLVLCGISFAFGAAGGGAVFAQSIDYNSPDYNDELYFTSALAELNQEDIDRRVSRVNKIDVLNKLDRQARVTVRYYTTAEVTSTVTIAADTFTAALSFTAPGANILEIKVTDQEGRPLNYSQSRSTDTFTGVTLTITITSPFMPPAED